jgi:uncharacterized protein
MKAKQGAARERGSYRMHTLHHNCIQEAAAEQVAAVCCRTTLPVFPLSIGQIHFPPSALCRRCPDPRHRCTVHRSALPGFAAALFAGLLVLFAGTASAQHAPALGGEHRPIRALYITGGGFHDFDAQERIVPPGLAARTNIEWTIDHTAEKATDVLIARHENTNWADQFDVVVYNMSFSFVVDAQWIERIAHAHRDRGVAAVLLHGATHSYRRSETDAWRELMGAASYRHDQQREFGVERLAPDHPIMQAFPRDWSPGVDELYEIEKVWPGMTPARAGLERREREAPPARLDQHVRERSGVRDDHGP